MHGICDLNIPCASSAFTQLIPVDFTCTYLLPSCNLSVVPDSGGVRLAARLSRDEHRLGDQERARDAGPLSVELHTKVGRHVSVVVAVAGLGSENNAMSEFDVQYTQFRVCKSAVY